MLVLFSYLRAKDSPNTASCCSTTEFSLSSEVTNSGSSSWVLSTSSGWLYRPSSNFSDVNQSAKRSILLYQESASIPPQSLPQQRSWVPLLISQWSSWQSSCWDQSDFRAEINGTYLFSLQLVACKFDTGFETCYLIPRILTLNSVGVISIIKVVLSYQPGNCMWPVHLYLTVCRLTYCDQTIFYWPEFGTLCNLDSRYYVAARLSTALFSARRTYSGLRSRAMLLWCKHYALALRLLRQLRQEILQRSRLTVEATGWTLANLVRCELLSVLPPKILGRREEIRQRQWELSKALKWCKFDLGRFVCFSRFYDFWNWQILHISYTIHNHSSSSWLL